MRIQDIVDRLNDVADLIDKDENYRRYQAAPFLRRTATRIQRDAILEQKLAEVTALHNLQTAREDFEELMEESRKP